MRTYYILHTARWVHEWLKATVREDSRRQQGRSVYVDLASSLKCLSSSILHLIFYYSWFLRNVLYLYSLFYQHYLVELWRCNTMVCFPIYIPFSRYSNNKRLPSFVLPTRACVSFFCFVLYRSVYYSVFLSSQRFFATLLFSLERCDWCWSLFFNRRVPGSNPDSAEIWIFVWLSSPTKLNSAFLLFEVGKWVPVEESQRLSSS